MPKRDINTDSENDLFEFDAPRIKDFTKKEYQSQKKRIEKLLETHGNPGVPQDRSKTPKEKKIKIEKPAPRKTFFSELFKETKQKEVHQVEKDPKEREDPFEQSVDDGWFKQKEKETEEFENLSVKTMCPSSISDNPIFTKDLFVSEEEKEILPQLKVIATPPIKKMKRNIHSVEFALHEIQELSKSFEPLCFSEDEI